MNGINVQMVEWWYRSGLAREAAQNLLWFVLMVFCIIGVGIWLGMNEDKKGE